jgi:hypothetical protein
MHTVQQQNARIYLVQQYVVEENVQRSALKTRCPKTPRRPRRQCHAVVRLNSSTELLGRERVILRWRIFGEQPDSARPKTPIENPICRGTAALHWHASKNRHSRGLEAHGTTPGPRSSRRRHCREARMISPIRANPRCRHRGEPNRF